MRCIGVVVAVVVSLSVGSPFAAAQNAPAEFLSVLTVTAKPDMIGQFEAFARQVNEAAKQIGDPRSVRTYQSRFGGPINEYVFATGFNEWSEVDSWMAVPEMLIKAHGEEEGTRIMQAGMAAVASVEATISRTQRDVTNVPGTPPTTPDRFARVVRTEIHPGMAAEYELLIAKRAAAQKKLGHQVVRRVIVEGAAGTYTTVQTYNDHAERDQLDNLGATLTELFGEAEMRQAFEAGNRAVRNRVFRVIEHRPDLSR